MEKCESILQFGERQKTKFKEDGVDEQESVNQAFGLAAVGGARILRGGREILRDSGA